MVAIAVQEIVKVAERNGGIGQEIKTITQTQTQNQEKLETGIQKIQNRSGFAKFFIGANYSEIKNSQKLLEQNKEQIQKLNEIRTKIGKVVSEEFPKDNPISIMMSAGAGGNVLNITQMACCVGQQALWGKRIDIGERRKHGRFGGHIERL